MSLSTLRRVWAREPFTQRAQQQIRRGGRAPCLPRRSHVGNVAGLRISVEQCGDQLEIADAVDHCVVRLE